MGFELDKVEKKSESTGKKSKKLKKELEDLGKKGKIGIAALGAGIATLAAVSVATFGAMEADLIGVSKTTNFSGKELDKFTDIIFDLGQEIEGVETSQLQQIAGVAGQLGIKGVDNISKFTGVMAKLSLATDIVGDEGAADVARLLNVVGEGVETVDRFGAVLVALGNNSAATESEILGLATEVAQATATFSVSSAETLAMGAAMKSLGVRAELGGSVVGRAMRSIEKAISSGGEEIKRLSAVTGIAEEDLEQAFGENATNVFQKWLHGIGGVIEGGTSAADALAAFGLSGEEVLKVLPTMAVNAGQLDKALSLANDELERGTALDKEAATAGEGLNAQWQVAKNIAGEVAFTVGKGLAPAIKDVIADTRAWWSANKDLVKDDIGTWVNRAVNATAQFIDIASQVDDVMIYSFGQIQKGWENVTFGFKLGGLKFAEMANGMGESADDLVIKLADKFSQIPLIGEGIAESFKETWYVGANDANKYTKEIEKLTKQHEFNLEAIERVQRASIDLTISKKKYGEVSSDVAESVIADEDKMLKATLEANNQKIKSAETVVESSTLKTAEQLNLEEYLADETKRLTSSELEYELYTLRRSTEAMRSKAGDDKELLDEITEYQNLKQDEILAKYEESQDKKGEIGQLTDGLLRDSNEAVISAFISGENVKTSVASMASKRLQGYAIDAATKGLSKIFEGLGAQIGAWMGLGTAQSATDGDSWQQKVASGLAYVGGATAAVLAGKVAASSFHADGGWLMRHPSGGAVAEGSGLKDDVFAGTTKQPGGMTNHWIQGGEYVIDKETTKANLPLLDWMRGKKRRVYADGGPVGDTWEVTENMNSAGFDTFVDSVIQSKGNWKKAILEGIAYYAGSTGGMLLGKTFGKDLFFAGGGQISGAGSGTSARGYGWGWDDLLDPFGIGDTVSDWTGGGIGLGGIDWGKLWDFLRSIDLIGPTIARADKILHPWIEDILTPGKFPGWETVERSLEGMYAELGDEIMEQLTYSNINPLGLSGGGKILDSYANGTDYVPQTGAYQLHQGESVTPAGKNNTSDEVKKLRDEVKKYSAQLAFYAKNTADLLKKFDIDGLPPTRS